MIRNKYKYSLVACARWEEEDIVEWVEYHRQIGFDHVYVYSNDDDPTALFKRLMPYLFSEIPYVTFMYWPQVGDQPGMYLHFLKNFKQETEWFCFLDIDEFFVFKGENNVSRFMRNFECDYDAVYFNWLVYGNSDFVDRTADSVLLRYINRARTIDPHTKVITRSASVDEPTVRAKSEAGAIGFWHFWGKYYADTMRMVNVLRDDVRRYDEEFPKNARSYTQRPGVSAEVIDTAYIAHYQFKSERDFARRVARGGFLNADAWGDFSASRRGKVLLAQVNEVRDDYLARYWLRRNGERFDISPANVPRPPFPNLALRRPAFQSSVYRPLAATEPPGACVFGRGNNGVRTGAYGFHTAFEPGPWWMVDLLDRCVIHALHVYNRGDDLECAKRAAGLVVEVSGDQGEWTKIFALGEGQQFGGLRSSPLVVRLAAPVVARFVRLRLSGIGFLHLDEVEVYGLPATDPCSDSDL